MPVVFDTNVVVSAVLMASSSPSRAIRWAAANDTILASAATLSELASTIEREKFDRYASRLSRREFVAFFQATVQMVVVRRSVRICRDPKDDKFLEVAANGGANAIVSGDDDLLALGSFEGLPILRASEYLERVQR